MIRVHNFLFVFAMVFMCACVASGEETLDTSVCEIIRTPAVFDGKIVRIRATVISAFEVFALRDTNDTCQSIWLNYPQDTEVVSGSEYFERFTANRPKVNLKHDSGLDVFQKSLKAEMYPRGPKVMCFRCNHYEVTATFLGRVDYAGKGHGFGHGSMYPVRFILESVRSVATKDLAANYDSNAFSTEPVRFPEGYLSGQLMNPQGRPVEDVEVSVVSAQDQDRVVSSSTTDAKGHFKLGVAPGAYILGINLDDPASLELPFAATYYPGVTDGNAAMRLTVSDRQEIRGLNFQLTSPLAERKVLVKVVWSDGTPAPNANVWLTETRYPALIVGDDVGQTNESGLLTLIGFAGVDYWVHADIGKYLLRTQYCAEKIFLKGGGETRNTLEIQLTRTGDFCEDND